MTEHDISFNLEWPKVCRLACIAMIEGRTFEEVVTAAVDDWLRKPATVGRQPTRQS